MQTKTKQFNRAYQLFISYKKEFPEIGLDIFYKAFPRFRKLLNVYLRQGGFKQINLKARS